MECPICFESYSKFNPARGPEECSPHACQHAICFKCCLDIADTGTGPFKCSICRRDIASWFVRAFKPPFYKLRNELADVMASLREEDSADWRINLTHNIDRIRVMIAVVNEMGSEMGIQIKQPEGEYISLTW